MQTNRQHVDFFKAFKILDLKKLNRCGEVKLVQDKVLGRKVLAIEGAVSTQNYIVFQTADVMKMQPMLSFSQRYLYIIGEMEVAKIFCFQLTLSLNTKLHKVLYSTIHKAQKKTPQGILQMPLDLRSSKWSIIVIDLYQLCQKYTKLQEMRLTFMLTAVQVRAHSKIRNIYLSDNLYDAKSMPKDMELPLRPGEDFYAKYAYVLVGAGSGTDGIQIGQTKEKQEEPLKQTKELEKHEQAKSLSKQKPTHDYSENLDIKQTKSLKSIVPKKKPKLPPKDPNLQVPLDADEPAEQAPTASMAPRPKTTFSLAMQALEGNSLAINGVTALGCFITEPTLFAVHHKVKCMAVHGSFPFQLVVGYEDGSVCVWDLIRQKVLHYLKTQLVVIKQIEAMGEGEDEKVFMVGLDRMKRETILIINYSEVLFRQISTYPIHSFLLAGRGDQEKLVTYGFENIRIWKLNQSNRIITGVGLYLGKMNRKVLYCGACLIGQDKVLVVDNCGYVTRVDLQAEKMDEMRRISENGLDSVLNVKEMQVVIIAQSSGTLKMLSYSLDILESFQLGNRIKSMSYSLYKSQIVLQLANVNNSTATFNVTTSQYQYKTRQHTSAIISLAYSGVLNKLVSISRDNTMRIWSFSSLPPHPNPHASKGRLQYEIKQQYQFLISNGEVMTCLALDASVYAYVGFGDAIVRKINLDQFEIQDEKSFVFREHLEEEAGDFQVRAIRVSKNNRNLLVSVSEEKAKGIITNCYVVLCSSALQIIYKYSPPPQYTGRQPLSVLSDFSQTHKKFYICWSYGSLNRFQIYSLTENPSTPITQFYLQSAPLSINYTESTVQVQARPLNNQPRAPALYEIYDEETGNLIQSKAIHGEKHWVKAGVVVRVDGEKLGIGVLGGGAGESIDVPEEMAQVVISPQGNDGRNLSGLVFTCGVSSHSLYAFGYDIRNVEKSQPREGNVKEKDVVYEEQEEELQCVESRLVPFNDTQSQMKPVRNMKLAQNRSQSSSPAKKQAQLRGLYENQEQLYEQCKQFINPQPYCHQIRTEEEHEAMGQPEERVPGKSGVELIYGWSPYYPSSSATLIWQPSLQTALFVSQRSLILHQFSQPVQQKIVRLPTHPDLVCQLGKYIGVALGNQIRLYSGNLEYVRGFSVLGEGVASVGVSQCQGYLVVVSSCRKMAKCYIQVVDIVTTSTLCSTYRQYIQGPLTLLCNPYQQRLQFLLLTPSQVHFYRLTSILTLQTQQLQKLPAILHSTDIGSILSSTYLKLQEEELILLGMHDGSVIVVDSRANSILVVCRKVCGERVKGVYYHPLEDGEAGVLVLATQSNNILVYQLEDCTLNSLVYVLETRQPKSKLTADSEITLHSSVHKLAGNSLGMLAMTKFGTLWLFDITGSDTIKILSVHTGEGEHSARVVKAVLHGPAGGNYRQMQIITGAEDGTVKETSLANLEQVHEIYRPRRTVQDIIIANNLLVIAFNMQLCFYALPSSSSSETKDWKYLGSIDLMEAHSSTKAQKQSNLSIRNVKSIPQSDSYVVVTSQKLFIIHYNRVLTQQTGKLKLEIKEIGGGLDQAENVEVRGSNCILAREKSKVNVWLMKERRGVSMLDQLGRLEELVYYMMDVYQVQASDAKFVPVASTKAKEYLVGLKGKPVILWRDFQQHSIVREIQIGVGCPRVVQFAVDGNFLLGDQEGTLWHIKQNGLTLNKIRVFDSPIAGIEQLSASKVIVYGPSLAVVTI